LKAASRKTLAAALTLGAAVFAWPVEAFQCVEPTFVNRDQSIDETFDGMRRHAETVVARANSIFKGQAVSAKPLKSNSPYEARILVTYKISEWKKGSGRPYAKVVYLPWCGGECSVKDLVKASLSDKEKKFHFASGGGRMTAGTVALDGYIGPCHAIYSKRPINAQHPQPRHSENFGQFLYDLAVAEELEKLPSKRL
jgi:hypothetical protein